LIFAFVSKNTQHFLEITFYIGAIAVVLFVLFIPESPRYILMKNPNDKEGIRILNFIAWFNGSKFRVPEDACFDQFG